MSPWKSRLKDMARGLAYGTGAMGAWHRWRNHRTLTVFMFHRVLPADDPAFALADREFTFSVQGFERTLDFIGRHYTVVRHADVLAAVEGRGALPPCAALITFDDGWRDTLTHARAPLASRGWQAVLFLATEVPSLGPDRWWQDQLVALQGRPDALAALGRELGLADPSARAVTVALARASDEQRHAWLDPLLDSPALARQMLRPEDLTRLGPTLVVAGHGHTHAPLRQHPDPAAELRQSQALLTQWQADDWAMSFPHGEYDARCLEAAHAEGFKVCYTSEAHLMRCTPGQPLSAHIGRIHVPENQWTCDDGVISHAKLASFLFTRAVMA